MDVRNYLLDLLKEFRYDYDCQVGNCKFDLNFDFDEFWDATVSVIIKEGCS